MARQENPTDDRALLFATVPGLHRGFGSAAALLVKGKAFFFSASIATYNSNHLQWYIGNAVANGRVLSNGRRVSDQVVDGSILHLHAATCISERSEVQLVLIVDSITSRADVPGPSKTMPVKQLLLSQQIMQDAPGVPVVDISPRVQNMPPMLQSDGESMRLILEADSIAQLLMMRCERQAVSRGRECAMTTKNAALDLLLHELGKINCRYPGMVTKTCRFDFTLTSTWDLTRLSQILSQVLRRFQVMRHRRQGPTCPHSGRSADSADPWSR